MIATVIQAIILGIVQGATEFIPISSSAHLIVFSFINGFLNSDKCTDIITTV